MQGLSGRFDWAAPDEEVHAFVNDLERPIGTYLYGRRMYKTMVFWETAGLADDDPEVIRDFGRTRHPSKRRLVRYALDTPDLATFNEPALYRRGR